MRIVIDMQGAQTESRFRGIGRYTLSLAQAIVRNRGEHEVILALSGLFPDTIEPIRATFESLLPQENIRVWQAPGPVREGEPGNTWRREAAELIREAFLTSLNPDIVHISSLFEGYVDDAVTSIGRFDQAMPVSVSLYDLIPLLSSDHYLKPNSAYQQYYLRKIDHLRRASLLLAISEFSRQEGLTHLGVPDDKVVNVSTAADTYFRPVSISKQEVQTLQRKFGLTRPFVLYTGGADERKNLLRLIHAYAKLPTALRKTHQLVFAGKMPEGNIHQLRAEAKSAGLRADELRFTGYISDDELVQIYNLCKLFVFPSWHEGFGLPALEAMACGAAVIGANASSLPEVIGLEDALFDPYSDQAIADKMVRVLTDEAFCVELERNGLEQARHFSWDNIAQRAIVAIESWHAEKAAPASLICKPVRRRPKLAYISPLPPARSGISDYSAELLPELSRHYDIEVIVAQESISDPWVKANCPVHSVDWFKVHTQRYDRVLYHFGNSPFHQHMFDLLEDVPGIVVLHDFFLSSIMAHMDEQGFAPGSWVHELYHDHGYTALQHRFHAKDIADVVWAYPCNLSVLRRAQGIIVHSEASRRLARQWYGEHAGDDWAVIPLLRVPAVDANRAATRRQLKFKDDEFVVCSFGLLDPTKLNHRLLDAWLASPLAKNKQCVLVFVGENHGGYYGQQLLKTIRKSGLRGCIRITGWTDTETFRHYLAAADVGVQLRTRSRGETSAAVLDCMNYGLPTIVNAHGSMVDLPEEGVWKLPDVFEDADLIQALETLWQDNAQRIELGAKARKIILSIHNPRQCATQYAQAIEGFHNKAQTDTPALTTAIAVLDGHQPSDQECMVIANSIAQSIPGNYRLRQLLIDISVTCRTDLKTGIERVARALVLALIKSPPSGYRVEPVYLTDEGGFWHYRYARRYTLGLLGCPTEILTDEIVEPTAGDLLLGADVSGHTLIEAEKSGLFALFRDAGVAVHFIVYDLLPVLMPQVFPPGANVNHAQWLEAIGRLDGAVCISHAVADELVAWMGAQAIPRQRPFKIGWFHLGADTENSAPTHGIPDGAKQLLMNLTARPSFLMVGTIEPRKGHVQALAAFTRMWKEEKDINLVIVGKEGWKGLPDNERRNIPNIINILCNHPELGKRLFWLDGISDEYLEKVYAASTCLIAASEGEGFGLPLIEAAQHKLPIIARDIPVFREVAGEHAFYFSGKKPKDLADAIIRWLSMYEAGTHPKSDTMPWLTWRESAENLKKILLEGRCEPSWAPASAHNSRQGVAAL